MILSFHRLRRIFKVCPRIQRGTERGSHVGAAGMLDDFLEGGLSMLRHKPKTQQEKEKEEAKSISNGEEALHADIRS